MNSTYRVEPGVDGMVAAAARNACEQGVIRSAHLFASLDSTNSEALRWLANNERQLGASIADWLPRLVITDSQTDGRGRHGNQWIASDDCLAMSLVGPFQSPCVSLAVGVAVAETLEHLAAPLQCGLKWPNDVWISKQKVAGILIERNAMAPDQIVIGIGVNLQAHPAIQDCRNPAVPPTSVLHGARRFVTRSDLLQTLLPSLTHWCHQSNVEPDLVQSAFRLRCQLEGHDVALEVAGDVVQGHCHGIDPSGGLRVAFGDRVRVIQSGDVRQIRSAGHIGS
ncbi:MAG: biotin--[acetyl-CoA-carboxylase] ligase [Planctomycetota bacterium]